jgi:hypothetical protein
VLVEMSFLETLDDELRDALRVVHRRAARRQFGATTQARPESGLFGFGGGVSKKRQLASFGVFAGQIGRQ